MAGISIEQQAIFLSHGTIQKKKIEVNRVNLKLYNSSIEFLKNKLNGFFRDTSFNGSVLVK